MNSDEGKKMEISLNSSGNSHSLFLVLIGVRKTHEREFSGPDEGMYKRRGN